MPAKLALPCCCLENWLQHYVQMTLICSSVGFRWGAGPREASGRELLLDWLYWFLTVEEQYRLLGWHLGESL